MTLDRRVAGPVVCSILESDLSRTLARLDQLPDGTDWVEIRGDCLTCDELRQAVACAGLPAIATIRRRDEGGAWQGSEAERRIALESALAAGAARVDVELGADELRRWAAGLVPDRVILSHHGAACRPDALRRVYSDMASRHRGPLKIVALADSVDRLGAVRELLSQSREDRRPLAAFALGRAGALTRILAPSWGSWATYGSAAAGRATAPGQFTARDLIDVYDVSAIGPATRWFVLVGSAVYSSPSPAMHAASLARAGLDARYVPVEIDDWDQLDPVLGSNGLVEASGLAVTMPFKHDAFRACASSDDVARAAEAVNTVRVENGGWAGINTDGPAARELIGRHVSLSGSRVAIAGAGGTAVALAVALAGAGADVTLFNRTQRRAREAATRIGVGWAGWGRLADAAWDVFVQATPLGSRGEPVLPPESLKGRVVLDVVYARQTPLMIAARAAGMVAIDGFDLLVAQAALQFRELTGLPSDLRLMRAAGAAWLDDLLGEV